MTEGDQVAVLGVRVRLGAGATVDDVRALKTWLEREEPLEDLLSRRHLRIEEQAGTDGADGRLGPDIELVLRVLGDVVTVAALTEYTARAVKTWTNNRRRLQGGDPEPQIRPLDPDGE
ncbi:effector-associated constant component EACC1 [Streptomyces coeruleorubidus]|uniref:effector-associated constant component EACC1 n=1 Tax=Streptomyces coeruleorubidus TaxID=116188 RepID=UPI00339E246E